MQNEIFTSLAYSTRINNENFDKYTKLYLQKLIKDVYKSTCNYMNKGLKQFDANLFLKSYPKLWKKLLTIRVEYIPRLGHSWF